MKTEEDLKELSLVTAKAVEIILGKMLVMYFPTKEESLLQNRLKAAILSVEKP